MKCSTRLAFNNKQMTLINPINIWSAPNDWTGDSARVWGQKINDNFDNLNNEKAEISGQVFTWNISAPNLSWNNTGDETNASIKTKYELNADTNAFTDAEKTKLAGIEENATTDQNASEVPYTNTASGLSATDVQGAIDEVEGRIDTNESNIQANTQAIANLATAQGSFSNTATPVFSLTTSEQTVPFTVTAQSSDLSIYEFDDANDEIDIKVNAPFNFSTNMTFNHNTNAQRTITIRGRKVSDDSLVYSRQVTIEAPNGDSTNLNTATLLTIGQGSYPSAPFDMYLTMQADGTGIELNSFSSILSTGTQYDVAVVDEFVELTDTPSDYTGQANNTVQVKWDETGLEFVLNRSYPSADETKLAGIEAGAQVNAVDSVAGKTGAVSLVKWDVGLGNVDNTSDADKPISTATQSALDAKQDTLVSWTNIKTINGATVLGSWDISVWGSGHVIQEEGVALTQRTNLNFIWASVTATDNPWNDATDIAITATAGGGSSVIVSENVTAGDPIVYRPLTNIFDISLSSFSTDFSVSWQDNNPLGIQMKPDWTKLFILGNQNNSIFIYDLTTGFDLTTASYSGTSVLVNTEDALPLGFNFNGDGTKMYIVGNTGRVYEYDLSTAYDPTTLTYTTNNFSFSWQAGTPVGVWFNDNWSKMYMLSISTDAIYEYNLSTPYAVTSAVYTGNSIVFQSFDNNPRGFAFNSDGTKLLISGSQTMTIYQYDLNVWFDLSTANLGVNFSVSAQDGATLGIYLSPSKFYITGVTNDKVYEYDMVTELSAGFFKWNGGDNNLSNFVWFANETVTSGNLCWLDVSGTNTNQSWLTAGVEYYLWVWTIVTTALSNAIKVGKAISATEIEIYTWWIKNGATTTNTETFIAGEALTAGVPVSQAGNGRVYQYDGNNYPNYIWITNESSASGADIKVTIWLINDKMTGLSIGKYYIGFVAGDTWATKADMPWLGRRYPTASAVDGKIYVLWGYSGGTLATNEEYNPVTDTWTTKASMPTARHYLASAVVAGKIYAMWGYNTSTSSKNEEYDAVTNTWTTKADMITGRYYLWASAVWDKIYTTGGGWGLQVVEEFDTINNTWASKTSIPSGTWQHGQESYAWKVYIFWWSGASSIVREYDPVGDSWALKASMPTWRSLSVCKTVGTKIYSIWWGSSGFAYGTFNEEYDPVADSWVSKASMPTWRSGHAGAVVNNKIYCIWGYNGSSVKKNEEYNPNDINGFTTDSSLSFAWKALSSTKFLMNNPINI